jgi:hypothetical protein
VPSIAAYPPGTVDTIATGPAEIDLGADIESRR